jgi:hypothetical protein
VAEIVGEGRPWTVLTNPAALPEADKVLEHATLEGQRSMNLFNPYSHSSSGTRRTGPNDCAHTTPRPRCAEGRPNAADLRKQSSGRATHAGPRRRESASAPGVRATQARDAGAVCCAPWCGSGSACLPASDAGLSISASAHRGRRDRQGPVIRAMCSARYSASRPTPDKRPDLNVCIQCRPRK